MAASSSPTPKDTTAIKSYTRDHLQVFNILQHPVWVFDIVGKSMWWSNVAGVQLWNASSLEELLARDFASDMSAATESRLKDQLEKMRQGKIYKEQWTFYPGGGNAITLHCTCSVIYLENERTAMLVEAELPDNREFDTSLTRGIELLRHVPTPVSEFDKEGSECIYRNPEDLQVFGAGRTTFVDRFLDRELGEKTLQKVQEGQECKVEAADYVGARYLAPFFAHSISGGYEASFYGYLWSDVMAADAFGAFRETSIFDENTAARFREYIFESGASKPQLELFEKFRGRAPSSAALIREMGLE